MRIVGLDLSLTATGVYTEDGPELIKIALPEHADEYQRVARLYRLVGRVDKICKTADVVVIEGYGFQAKHSPGHSLGELGGAVKLCLFQRGIPFVIVSTNQLKQYATGKGNSSKDQVLSVAARENVYVDNNNLADAYFLRQMGLAHYLNKGFVLPKYRAQAVANIRWPEIKETVSA